MTQKISFTRYSERRHCSECGL